MTFFTLCYDADNEPQCACPKAAPVNADGLTCPPEENTNQISDNFINAADKTWRPLLGFPDMCVIKKYSQYSVEQPFALETCNPDKRKTQFAYDDSTGLLSHDSDKTQWNNFCVQAADGNNSRLRVAECDASDMFQVWDFDKLNGHVYLRGDRKKCVVVGPVGGEGSDPWMKISNKCASNTWGKLTIE